MCPNCSSAVPEDHAFCGKCGHPVRQTLTSLSERLTKAETRSALKEQKYLELETVENIMNGVQKRVTRFLFFAGIPVVLAGIALSVMFGKDYYDLKTIAANAQAGIGAVLEQAKSVAGGALATANDARSKSDEVHRDVQTTQAHVGQLKAEVDRQLSEAKGLENVVSGSKEKVAALEKAVQSQSQQVTQLSEQVRGLQVQKATRSVQQLYLQRFGEHVAGSYDGFIDPKAKKPNELYVVFALTNNQNPGKTTAVKVGDTIQTLNDHGYKVLLGGAYLLKAAAGSDTALGPAFSDASCPLAEHDFGPPCILYFQRDLKDKAFALQALVAPVQAVPQNRIRYVSPESMDASLQELLKLSALDALIVLSP